MSTSKGTLTIGSPLGTIALILSLVAVFGGFHVPAFWRLAAHIYLWIIGAVVGVIVLNLLVMLVATVASALSKG